MSKGDVMTLTDSERLELETRAKARTVRADSARRARLILLLAEGRTWAEIRAKIDCSDSYIDRWSKRFIADRLAGLFARHAGRQRYKVTDRLEARVLARTIKHKPADGSTHWSSRKLAAGLGDLSHMTVARIWAKTRYCRSRPGAQSVTDSNISGMARCPCTRPSTLRPAKCWARPQLVILQLNSSPFSATSLPINLAAKTFT